MGAETSTHSREKGEYFRREFGLNEPEGIVQEYSFPTAQLFISQNFLCYTSTTSTAKQKVPFGNLLNIELITPQTLVFTAKQSSENGRATHKFSGPSAKEAFVLAMHLWKNPPSYIDVPVLDQSKSTGNASGTSTSTDLWGQKTPSPRATTSSLNTNYSSETQLLQQRPQVDTTSADLLLASALEGMQIQQHIMGMVAEQSEQLQNIAEGVDNINSNLGRADHHMKRIESLPFSIFGGSEKRTNEKTRVFPIVSSPLFEIDVVYKKADGSLHPGILVLDANTFKCVEPETNKPYVIGNGASWKYGDIKSLLIRSQHEHMNIIFGNGCLQVISSYLQVITNQLFLRGKAANHSIDVTFEPGVRKFEYMDERIARLPPKTRPPKGSNNNNNNNIRNLPSTAELMTDPDKKAAMKIVDTRLDQTYDTLVAMKAAALAMQRQFDQDNELLDRTNLGAENAVKRTQTLNQRVAKQLNQ